MKYLALYRKFRPVNFDKVIGQEHIIKILSAQVLSQSVGHAYLFCGARGTGKTSVAKIFAKAVNCQNPTLSGSPCNGCNVCNSLGKGNNMDILEIDAASNNKVEDIRDIIDKAQYPPVNGKYKVYIIDEVHMLSGQAFNALLKTLEEPPLHAVFILATTEVYKLPATILSRCMRFDFKLVPSAVIASLLKAVFDETGKKYEEGAVNEIARAGEGSVRDALSIADTCISYSKDILKHLDVLEILSASDRGKIADICDFVLNGDISRLLTGIDDLSSAGKSIAVLNKDILTYLRDLTVLKSCKDAKEILIYPEEVFTRFGENIKKYDLKKILRCLEIFANIETELKYSLHPRIIFEAAAVKCASAENDNGISSFELRISRLESEINNLKSNKTITKAENTNVSTKKADTKPMEKSMDFDFVPPENDYPDFIPPWEENPKQNNAKAPLKNQTRQQADISEIAINENNVVNKQTDTQQNTVVKKIAENETTEKANTAGDNAKSANGAVIWGNVIRSLRQSGAGLLYTLCGEMKAKISGNDFIIFADNEMAGEILKKPKNIERLKSIINAEREYNVIIKKGEDSDINSADNDIEKLKELSGGKLIIKD